MVPRHYPLVFDFHAEAGGVGGGYAAVFGHGHAGYGADFLQGDAGVGAHPELCHWGFGHCEGEVLAVGCAGACVGDGGDAGCLGDGVYLDGLGESAAPLEVGLGDVYGAMLDELAEGVASVMVFAGGEGHPVYRFLQLDVSFEVGRELAALRASAGRTFAGAPRLGWRTRH